ncbi:acyltransferase [Erwinia pyri]|uniref:Acyltransferase n=1 Tax=Erwinia pyri TaxID=3062598 RepID=A0AA50DFK3_9GAMM|nr:acyltransferase [Erwinia sp. DE2]WLS77199.1 acyltransferase [Erwinia sp. DE2]
MKSDNHSYLSRLDHLRFVAAIIVILHHCKGKLPYPQELNGVVDFIKVWLIGGSTGVSLFLVLSGFIFCVISNGGEKKIDYKKFIKNRLLRIAPLVIFLFFILITVGRQKFSPIDILRILTLQMNTGNTYTGWGDNIYPIGGMWTIAVEFQFYLIFPFLISFFHKKGWAYFSKLVLLMIFIKFTLLESYGIRTINDIYHTIIGRLDQFLIGIIAGWLYLKNKHKKNKPAVGIAFILISFSLLTALLFYSLKANIYLLSLKFTLEAIFWSFITYCYVTLNLSINKSIDSTLSYLGGLSFSMYLLHIPLSKFIYSTFMTYPTNSFTTLVNGVIYLIPLTILVSIATYSLIEKPFLEMRVKYIEGPN